jgi:hypothetical protein
MFEHDHTHEIIRKLDEILAQNEIIRTDQLHLREIIMATLADVQAAQATETTAITAAAARVAALPQGAASATDLDGIVATANSNTAAINAIDPATVVTPPTP